ncbi:MAG: hypothetical protein JNM17_03765 [Archangium sp.]|nr:hypothetical protein [Archangium sp.]
MNKLSFLVLPMLLALACTPPNMVKNTNRGELHVTVDGTDTPAALNVSFDVGSVAVGSTRAITVVATNVGADPMDVIGVSLGSVGNGSWFVRDVNGKLAPGASLTSMVTFAPIGAGAQATQVTFSHDADAAFPSVQLTGTGT